MASRSSGGGAILFAVFTGVLCLVFFVTTLLFYGQVSSLKAKANTATDELSAFVRTSERDKADRIAQTARNESVFGYMDDRLSRTMELISGSSNATFEQLQERIGRLGSDTPLLVQVEQQQREINRLNDQIAEAASRLAQTVGELNQQRATVDQLRAEFAEAQRRMQGTVDTYAGSAQEFVGRLEGVEQMGRQRIEDVIAERDAKVSELQSEIAQKDERILILEGQVQGLRNEKRGELLAGKPEFALVDGAVISVSGSQGTVTIDRGRNHKVVLGMTFSVYSDGASIRPDALGNYPAGKALLEVINVQDSSSTCRILRETRGNPIVRADVIANPLYDPNKSYKMLVFGNFDTNGDGRPSDFERDGVVAEIEAWGGKVVDDLAGDLDFLVLGSRPILPPKPRSDAPVEIQLEWIRLSQVVDRYDELQRRAEATSIPVLNLNRLSTLIGG